MTNDIVHARAMGGLSPRERTMLQSVSVLIPRNSSGTVRLAVYAGGTLNGGPHAGTPAKLLHDFGPTVRGQSGWLTLKHPGDGVPIPANTPVWLAWKGANGKAETAFREHGEIRTDFQTARGRWESKAIAPDANKPWPATWPENDGGGFDSFWYSCFLTLGQQP